MLVQSFTKTVSCLTTVFTYTQPLVLQSAPLSCRQTIQYSLPHVFPLKGLLRCSSRLTLLSTMLILFKKLFLCFKTTITSLISQSLRDQKEFIKLIRHIVIPIRQSIQNAENSVVEFNTDNQINSVPKPLLELVSLIVYGVSVENTGYSQPTLTISQLMTSNFRKNLQGRDNRDASRRNGYMIGFFNL